MLNIHSLISEFVPLLVLKNISTESHCITSDSWDLSSDAPVVFLDLAKVLRLLELKIDVLDFDIIKYHCVMSHSNSDEHAYYSCDLHGLIVFLIEREYLCIENLSDIVDSLS